MDLFFFDRKYRKRGFRVIAGIDEAGRGPLAGPVVAAAVVLPPGIRIKGLKDSKKLTLANREKIFDKINEIALNIGIEVVSHAKIDSINILNATYLAMRRALSKITVPVDLVMVDGWAIPDLERRQLAIIGGDNISASVAAASVIAKVTRDKIMTKFSGVYPEYGFHKHKGYGTREHCEALKLYGPCPIHRKTFAPVSECLNLDWRAEKISNRG